MEKKMEDVMETNRGLRVFTGVKQGRIVSVCTDMGQGRALKISWRKFGFLYADNGNHEVNHLT